MASVGGDVTQDLPLIGLRGSDCTFYRWPWLNLSATAVAGALTKGAPPRLVCVIEPL